MGIEVQASVPVRSDALAPSYLSDEDEVVFSSAFDDSYLLFVTLPRANRERKRGRAAPTEPESAGTPTPE